jgi:hypothetical protein
VKYLIQVRFNGADAVIAALPADAQASITAEFQAIQKRGGVIDANQLAPSTTARTVHVENGNVVVTDGPAVGDGAELSGYYLFDAASVDEAITFAALVPVARMGGTVEVRALVERS